MRQLSLTAALLAVALVLRVEPARADLDWHALGEEAATLLSDLIRVDTTNPPGGETAAANGESFNLGNPVETSIQAVVEQIVALAGFEVGVTPFRTEVEYGDRYEDIPRRIPSVEKAARILGWRAQTSLDKGLVSTIDWARAHPWWLGVPDPAVAAGR